MAKRRIRTIAGLQRASAAVYRHTAKHYQRPYVLQPALARNLARFDALQTIEDDAARFEAFRQIPALEFDLEAVWAGLTEAERASLAQQDRAKHPRLRLVPDGANLESIIGDLLREQGDPWKLKAKQFWPMLFVRLGQMGLKPSLAPDPKEPIRERIRYFVGGKRRCLTMGQFANLVSKIRRRLAAFH